MRHLHVLLAKWDADDGDVKQCAKEPVSEGNPDAAHEKPDDVHRSIEAPAGGFTHDPRSEGPQAEDTEFERLEPEGDADDGNHHGERSHNILDGGSDSAKDEPNDVTQDFHCLLE